MRISYWSSDVCSSDLCSRRGHDGTASQAIQPARIGQLARAVADRAGQRPMTAAFLALPEGEASSRLAQRTSPDESPIQDARSPKNAPLRLDPKNVASGQHVSGRDNPGGARKLQ